MLAGNQHRQHGPSLLQRQICGGSLCVCRLSFIPWCGNETSGWMKSGTKPLLAVALTRTNRKALPLSPRPTGSGMRSERQLSFFVGRENLFINLASVVLRCGPSLISEGHKICYAFTVCGNMHSSAVLRIETRQRHRPLSFASYSLLSRLCSELISLLLLLIYDFLLNLTEGMLLFTFRKETVFLLFFLGGVGGFCLWVVKVTHYGNKMYSGTVF